MIGWLLNYYGSSSIGQWIEDTVRQLLNLTNQTSPPIKLEPLFKQRKIIEYPKNYGHNKWQMRFTLAHETAHTFWFDLSTSPPRRTFPSVPKRISENFCNSIAAEILMPKWMVRRFLEEYPPMVEGRFDIRLFRKIILDFVKQFNVSPNTATRRLVEDLNLWNIVVLGVGWLPKISKKEVVRLGELKSEESGFVVRVNESRKSELETQQDYAWRIEWYAKPSWALNELFIPSTGSPSIHLEIVEELYQSSKETYCLENEERLTNFTVGNLRKHLRGIHGTRKQYFVCACFFTKATENGMLLPLQIVKQEDVDYHKRHRSKMAACVPLAPISENEQNKIGICTK